MRRVRWTAVIAALAGLFGASGCSGVGNGQLLCRMGCKSSCPCETCSMPCGTPSCYQGGPMLEGPGMVIPQAGLMGQTFVPNGPPLNGTPAPPQIPMPRAFDEAQPTPAGPTSRIRQ